MKAARVPGKKEGGHSIVRAMRGPTLYTLIALTGMLFGAEIVSSHVTQSLVLLVNAYHVLYNILSLLLLLVSHRMSAGKTLTNTFGWARVKVVGLLVNVLFLGALCFSVSVEAVQTMVHASHEDTQPRYPGLMVALGAADFALNILCFVLIGGYTHHQGCSMMTTRVDDFQMNCVPTDGSRETAPSASCCGTHHLLDVSRDVSSCLTVVACGGVLLFMDGLLLKYADALLAMAAVIVLLTTTYPFVRESGLILLQSIPNHIDVEGLIKKLKLEFPDVLDIHDLHVWRLTASEVIATCHVMLPSPSLYSRIEKLLAHSFTREGISSVTLQPEFLTSASWSDKTKFECILQCSSNRHCGALTCCGPLTAARHPLRHQTTPYDFAQIPSAPETAV